MSDKCAFYFVQKPLCQFIARVNLNRFVDFFGTALFAMRLPKW